MNKKQTITAFIEDELLDDELELCSDTSLFKDRILDSLNLLGLISFLERTYSIKIETAEVNFENLDTIQNIANFIDKKQSSR